MEEIVNIDFVINSVIKIPLIKRISKILIFSSWYTFLMARISIITLIISIIGFIIAGVAYGVYWLRGFTIGDLEDLWEFIVYAGVYGEWIKWGLTIGIAGAVATFFLALARL